MEMYYWLFDNLIKSLAPQEGFLLLFSLYALYLSGTNGCSKTIYAWYENYQVFIL